MFEFFIGVAVPPEFKAKVTALQERWMVGRRLHTEPHVTLIPPGLLSQDRGWLEQIRLVCAETKPFQLVLAPPQAFGLRVVYLGVESPGLVRLHAQLTAQLGFRSNQPYRPHLTLAKGRLTGAQVAKLQPEARSLQPYPTFDVTFVRIYHKVHPQARYEPHADLPFTA
ncbi:2'-5' RNA ligase family protein [Candidatus Parcubacteria bacterium]|nr:2'-5' RNA ligase family protein [Candidatus Parcubacteria bacterium]